MRELTTQEISSLGGSGPKFMNVLGGAIFGGVIGGVVGFLTGGPPGMIVGAIDGVVTGVGSTVIKESSTSLYDLQHDPNFHY